MCGMALLYLGMKLVINLVSTTKSKIGIHKP